MFYKISKKRKKNESSSIHFFSVLWKSLSPEYILQWLTINIHPQTLTHLFSAEIITIHKLLNWIRWPLANKEYVVYITMKVNFLWKWYCCIHMKINAIPFKHEGRLEALASPLLSGYWQLMAATGWWYICFFKCIVPGRTKLCSGQQHTSEAQITLNRLLSNNSWNYFIMKSYLNEHQGDFSIIFCEELQKGKLLTLTF